MLYLGDVVQVEGKWFVVIDKVFAAGRELVAVRVGTLDGSAESWVYPHQSAIVLYETARLATGPVAEVEEYMAVQRAERMADELAPPE